MKIPKNVLNKAIQIAKTSNVRRGKVGSVIFTTQGKIVTFAANTSFFGDDEKFTIHAEEFAILKLHRLRAKRFKKLNILVVRYRKCDGKISMAKPCKKCGELIGLFGLSAYYSNRQGDIVKF